jgi:hypothetical protein
MVYVIVSNGALLATVGDQAEAEFIVSRIKGSWLLPVHFTGRLLPLSPNRKEALLGVNQ